MRTIFSRSAIVSPACPRAACATGEACLSPKAAPFSFLAVGSAEMFAAKIVAQAIASENRMNRRDVPEAGAAVFIFTLALRTGLKNGIADTTMAQRPTSTRIGRAQRKNGRQTVQAAARPKG